MDLNLDCWVRFYYSVTAKTLAFCLQVSEFELQSPFYVFSRTNILRKDMKPFLCPRPSTNWGVVEGFIPLPSVLKWSKMQTDRHSHGNESISNVDNRYAKRACQYIYLGGPCVVRAICGAAVHYFSSSKYSWPNNSLHKYLKIALCNLFAKLLLC